MNYFEELTDELERNLLWQIETGLDAADTLEARLADGRGPFLPDLQAKFEFLVVAGIFSMRRLFDAKKQKHGQR